MFRTGVPGYTLLAHPSAALSALLLTVLVQGQVRAQPGPAANQAAPASTLFDQAFSQRKKTTVQQIALPAFIDGREAGAVNARIRPEGIEVDRKGVVQLLELLLQPQVLQRLQPASGASSWISLQELDTIEIKAVYSSQRIALDLDVPLSLRKTRSISLDPRSARATSARADDVLKPEPWSLIANGRWVVSQENSGGASIQRGRLFIDSAARRDDWVLEASGSVATAGEPSRFQRQETRLVRDWVPDAVRLSIGDITSRSQASATSLALGGIRLARNFGLNPALSVQSQPGTALSLPQGAAVDIRVNGLLARTLRLDAGVYSLSDIPVFTGANAVELTIVEPGGKLTRRSFDYFFDAMLLKPGTSDYELVVGHPVVMTGIHRSYNQSQRVVSGWWRRGWSEAFSAGASLQSRHGESRRALVAGAEGVWATPVGNFSSWIAQSSHETFGGHAATLQWRWNEALNPEKSRSLSVLLQSSRASRGYAPVSADLPGVAVRDHGLRLGALLQYNWSASLAISRRSSENPADSSSGASLTLRHRINRNWNAEASVSRQYQGTSKDRNIAFALSYSDRTSEGNSQAGLRWQTTASVQSDDQRRQWGGDIAGNTSWLGSDTDWRVAALRTSARSGQESSARARVLHGRAEGSLFALESAKPAGRNSLVEATIASALVGSSGGGWGWSAPVNDSALQFNPYKGYEGLKLLVDPQFDRAALTSDRFGTPPLASLNAYVAREIQLDIENLPPGRSMGVDRPVVAPAYRSVIVVPVGSIARAQTSGRLVNALQAAMPLQSLRLTKVGTDEGIDVFTNRKGQFLTSQLPAGTYELRRPGEALVLARFVISDQDDAVVNIGDVQVIGDAP